jgi:hypothetical protein
MDFACLYRRRVQQQNLLHQQDGHRICKITITGRIDGGIVLTVDQVRKVTGLDDCVNDPVAATEARHDAAPIRARLKFQRLKKPSASEWLR